MFNILNKMKLNCNYTRNVNFSIRCNVRTVFLFLSHVLTFVSYGRSCDMPQWMIQKAILIGCRPTGFLYFTVPSAAAHSFNSIVLSLTISIFYLFLFNITLILRHIPLSVVENEIECAAERTGLDII